MHVLPSDIINKLCIFWEKAKLVQVMVTQPNKYFHAYHSIILIFFWYKIMCLDHVLCTKEVQNNSWGLEEERACAMMSRTHYKRDPITNIQPSASNCETYL